MQKDTPSEKPELDDTCEAAVDQLLYANPIYGWGWEGNAEHPRPPQPFRFRLLSLWWDNGRRRGGMGQVQEKGHPFDGWTLLFSARHLGVWDFSARLGDYNVMVTADQISDEETARKKRWWPVRRQKRGSCLGFCVIGQPAGSMVMARRGSGETG